MMKNLRHNKDKKIEGNIIKDVKNVLRLKKEMDDNTIKDLSNSFRLKNKIDDTAVKYIKNLVRLKKWKKESKAIKNRLRDIRNLLEHG